MLDGTREISEEHSFIKLSDLHRPITQQNNKSLSLWGSWLLDKGKWFRTNNTEQRHGSTCRFGWTTMMSIPNIVNEGWMIKKVPQLPKNAREDENVNAWGNGHTFWVIYFTWSQNMFFKNGCSAQFNFLSILFPFPCNNFPTTSNDWA